MTTDTRLGTLEGRANEQTAAITDLREGQREIRDALATLNKRIDRVFFAMMGMGAAQIAMVITLVTRIVRG